ncbi:MinD/ParA family protein [Thermobrachium celere]|uniref:Flagellar synthesis regulator FleN n=1 Tax=Thermobrachium celere DSM 8682 TaxID=941824 RepID=R7RPN8_9CLOT|nr:MinD/ParA family protein [Thermobrachium celere]CDF58004.1 Flagellar synthesis regulator FleN [Thermobrachium celere DSM 8682]
MDQAQKLRQLVERKRQDLLKPKFKVITISSGKGGVGKTSFVVNLATSLAKRGLKVGILDADFGMANVDIMFGCLSKNNIFDVFSGNKTLREIIIRTEDGIEIIPGGSGLNKIYNIDEEKKQQLIHQFYEFSNYDLLLIDTGAGASDNVLNFIEIADDVIIITNSEPTSLTDAYSLIKLIYINNLNSNINVVVNRVKNRNEAEETFNKIKYTVNNFLQKDIKYLGYITEDLRIGQAIKKQTPYVKEYPNSEFSLCINKIASNLLGIQHKNKYSSFLDYLNKFLKVVGK